MLWKLLAPKNICTCACACLHLLFQLSVCNHLTWRARHVYDITLTPAGSFTPQTDSGSSFSSPGSWIIQCQEVVLVDVNSSTAMVSSVIPLWVHSSSESFHLAFNSFFSFQFSATSTTCPAQEVQLWPLINITCVLLWCGAGTTTACKY